jgi:LL-diaminopimelate aminotransferase
MIKESNRLDSLSEYYFSTKLEQVRQMNEKGLDIINLGIGSPDLAPSEQTIVAATKALQSEKNHGYPSYRGTPQLRQAFADWYIKTYDVKLEPAHHILPLLGSKEGLFYIAMAFVNPGEKVLVPNPGYPAYTSVCRLAGAKEMYYNLSAKNNWQPDFAELEKSDLSQVKLMFANYPHMPTGQPASEALLKALFEFGKKHNILIIHDNPYSQVLNAEKPLSLLKYDPDLQYSMELNSMSKAFNMAGWRVGVLCGHQKLINSVLKVKSNVDSGQFLPLQFGAIEALNNSQEWHNNRNEIYRKRRELVFQIFNLLNFEYDKNQMGLFVWAKAPDQIKDVQKFVDTLLEKARVFIVPGFIFGSQGERYARSSLCVDESRLQEAIKRIKGVL